MSKLKRGLGKQNTVFLAISPNPPLCKIEIVQVGPQLESTTFETQGGPTKKSYIIQKVLLAGQCQDLQLILKQTNLYKNIFRHKTK